MSLNHRLDLWANKKGSVPAFVFLNKNGQEKERISFQELREKALRIAGSLRERTEPQERVVLFFSPGLEFIIAFLGCLYAGVIAVPIPPPQSKRQLARSTPILDNAKPSLILALNGLGEGFDLPKLSFEEALCHDAFAQNIASNSIACLQYTSGSTSRPKGVILTHEHLFHQQKIIEEAFQHTEDSKILGWLPFYHDMGLIGNILQPLYLGVTCTLMAPLTFMQSPFVWLEAISRIRATTSGGPNFAYQLCSSKISDEDLAKLDLSSWTLAYNGAERVQSETMRTFAKKFGSCGFREEAFFPCYGMAETTLFVTGRQKIVSTLFTTPDGVPSDVVNCGSTIQGESVLIVDPKTRQIRADKSYGEIWVAGKSVADGYWNQPEETETIFRAFTMDGQGPFLRTGDLGFLENGELFVLGRLKNMVILRGKNYFPHDLEIAVVKAHSALTGFQGAAFSIEGQEGEELVIVQEIPRHIKDPEMIQDLFQNIKKSLVLEFTIAPVAIMFVVQNSLPRTTSGKIQYFLTRKNFQEKTLLTMFCWERGENTSLAIEQEINPFVQKLAQLLQIHPKEVSLDDPIINVGLDSLSGVQFLTWIEEEYGKVFDLPYLLSGATLTQIQALCAVALPGQPKETTPPRSEFPLSANQENVWVSSKLQTSPTAYNISFAVRVMGPFNPDAFRKALGDVMERHAVFRTHFVSKDSGPVQIVSEKVEIPFKICEDEGLDAPLFDLTKAPLFKIILQKRETDSVLFFHFHHLIFDGWS
ncbi:MAG TPA: AMP-binding protein, partial [Chlamydiales bacterium]|nr:AMP-binding protein [Chlamydiales bacterium]